MAVQDILKQVKCGPHWKIIGTTKAPYHLQEVGSRVNTYAKININTDGIGIYMLPATSIIKTWGNWGQEPKCVQLDGAPLHLSPAHSTPAPQSWWRFHSTGPPHSWEGSCREGPVRTYLVIIHNVTRKRKKLRQVLQRHWDKLLHPPMCEADRLLDNNISWLIFQTKGLGTIKMLILM